MRMSRRAGLLGGGNSSGGYTGASYYVDYQDLNGNGISWDFSGLSFSAASGSTVQLPSWSDSGIYCFYNVQTVGGVFVASSWGSSTSTFVMPESAVVVRYEEVYC